MILVQGFPGKTQKTPQGENGSRLWWQRGCLHTSWMRGRKSGGDSGVGQAHKDTNTQRHRHTSTRRRACLFNSQPSLPVSPSPLDTVRTYPLKVSQSPQTAGTAPWGSGRTSKSYIQVIVISCCLLAWPTLFLALPSPLPLFLLLCRHMGIATVVFFWSLSNHRTSCVFPLGPITMLLPRS